LERIMNTPPGDEAGSLLETTLSRRAALQALGAAPLGLLGVRGDRSSVRQSSFQPNILFILLDDLRADDLAAMPTVQARLVARGTSFANFFVTAPLCAPSRASILRGQYPHNHGVLRGSGVFGGFDLFQTLGEEQSTIATWLHETGYRTALIGKYLNGYPDGDGLPAGITMSFIPPGWDEWVGLINEGYYRLSINDNGEVKDFQSRKRNSATVDADESDSYSTDLFAAKAAEFVTDTMAADQPFFLYLAPYAVHGPADPPQRYRQTFAEA
jgi:N-acetylglucosamine-6-sulfatase